MGGIGGHGLKEREKALLLPPPVLLLLPPFLVCNRVRGHHLCPLSDGRSERERERESRRAIQLRVIYAMLNFVGKAIDLHKNALHGPAEVETEGETILILLRPKKIF